MVDFASLKNDEQVVEVGAGTGMITVEIAARVKKVFAVEFDREMVQQLKINLRDCANVEVIDGDFLTIPLARFSYSVVMGNVPYSISTKIIEKLIAERSYFDRAVITVQKEYGERLLANPGTKTYGSITVFTNYFFEVKKGFIIPASQFIPKPKIASMVIMITKRGTPYKPVPRDEAGFFAFVRKIFSYRRKQFSTIAKRFYHIGLAVSKRPEELSIEELIEIYNQHISPQKLWTES